MTRYGKNLDDTISDTIKTFGRFRIFSIVFLKIPLFRMFRVLFSLFYHCYEFIRLRLRR